MLGFHRDAVYNPRESHAALDAASMQIDSIADGLSGCSKMTERDAQYP
ncbi:hypothetical protein [Prosthecochloris sp.]|nr:hypothetical protein [Prosthecochloris sp.]